VILVRHKEEEKALALAGLFQAAALVQQVARTGEVNMDAYTPKFFGNFFSRFPGPF